MLESLYIENFVLIDQLSLSLKEGFSAFIGETGAGKSIFIDAISFLCGRRANADYVRNNTNKAIIEGAFFFDESSNATKILEENGFTNEEVTVITRELYANGKSVARINHRVVTNALLREVMEEEVDIHGQRDTGYLLNEKNHIDLLDAYGAYSSLLQEVKDAYKVYASKVKQQKQFEEEVYNEDDLEFFEYQLNEIQMADLKIGEDEELEMKEKEYKGMKASFASYHELFELYDSSFASDFYRFKTLVDQISSTKRSDVSKTIVNDAYYAIEDAIDSMRSDCSDFDFSEDEINAIQERLYIIQKMKRKYGGSIASILKKQEELEEKIEKYKNRSTYLEKLIKEKEEAFKIYSNKASELSKKRSQASKKLDKEIKEQLDDLMLEHAKFHTRIQPCKPSMLGMDEVVFEVCMNKGDEFHRLIDSASGGELSRLMLGLKVIFTRLTKIQTVIFDEIDTGVSGIVATKIGQKMKQLSKECQVIAVTHLSQVASCSDAMYFVAKISDATTTTSKISLLNEEESIQQLALLSFGETSEASLQASKELLERNRTH